LLLARSAVLLLLAMVAQLLLVLLLHTAERGDVILMSEDATAWLAPSLQVPKQFPAAEPAREAAV
jgi:hypothetical protein